jgi:hypothetical protein
MDMRNYPVDMEPLQHPFPPRQSPTRRDTQSTIKSTTSSKSLPISIPPGFYSLRLNGHCPRCRHLHKATPFNIRIPGNLNHTTIKCERCGAPWLALGDNSTCWSLLSTQTIDLDPTDTVFQSTLVRMVRSLAVVGSPALASVPESTPGGLSREQSVRSEHDPEGFGDHPPSPFAQKAAASEHIHLPAPDSSYDKTTERSRGSAKRKRALSLLAHLGGKIREQFAIMRKLHSQRFKRSKNESRMTAKGRGKLPVRQPSIRDNYSTQAESGSRYTDDIPDRKHIDMSQKEEEDARQQAASEAADRVKRNEEKLKTMSNEERTSWIREQLSDFKCHCLRNCQCRRQSTRSDIDHHIRTVPSFPQLTAQYLAQRRISTDIAGIGADFEGLNSMYSARMSIDSTTRLSQAATVVSVDSVATTSRPALPFLSPQPVLQRQPTRLSRPVSLPVVPLPVSRLREQLRQNEDERRSSMDSMTPGRAIGSLAGTTREETEFTVLPLASIPVEIEDLATVVEVDQVLVLPLQDSADQSSASVSLSQAVRAHTSDDPAPRDSESS